MSSESHRDGSQLEVFLYLNEKNNLKGNIPEVDTSEICFQFDLCTLDWNTDGL